MAQFGSALEWGSRGRWFESSRPDQLNRQIEKGSPSRDPLNVATLRQRVKALSLVDSVKYLEELGGRWAPNPDYGRSIIRDYMEDLLATKVEDGQAVPMSEYLRVAEELEVVREKIERIREIVERNRQAIVGRLERCGRIWNVFAERYICQPLRHPG